MAEKEIVPDYSKFTEDSIPPPEKEIKHTHKGRPDLDYDEEKVGPAEGTEFVSTEKGTGGTPQNKRE